MVTNGQVRKGIFNEWQTLNVRNGCIWNSREGWSRLDHDRWLCMRGIDMIIWGLFCSLQLANCEEALANKCQHFSPHSYKLMHFTVIFCGWFGILFSAPNKWQSSLYERGNWLLFGATWAEKANAVIYKHALINSLTWLGILSAIHSRLLSI